jgi:hypothetical protein
MRRLVYAIIVGCLALSASGVSSLIIVEPCTGYEPPGQTDTACPPMCVTCGCCAQAVEHAAVIVASSPDLPVIDIDGVLPGLPNTDPRPILHVPKPRLV